MKCPYCDANHYKVSGLDFNCKYCHKKIYVRNQPATSVTEYFTHDDAIKFDAVYDEVMKQKNSKDKFIP